MLLLLHSVFMLSVAKMLLKGEVGGHVLNNSHGNYIVDHGKSLQNHGIVFFNFCCYTVKKNTRKFNAVQYLGFTQFMANLLLMELSWNFKSF